MSSPALTDRLQQSSHCICIPAGSGVGERQELSQEPLSTPSWHGFGPGREAWRVAQPAHVTHDSGGRREGFQQSTWRQSRAGAGSWWGRKPPRGGPCIWGEGGDKGPWEKGGEGV